METFITNLGRSFFRLFRFAILIGTLSWLFVGLLGYFLGKGVINISCNPYPQMVKSSEEQGSNGHDGQNEDYFIHEVRPGDTIYELSRLYGVDEEEIMRINGISDPKKIHPGDILIIPRY